MDTVSLNAACLAEFGESLTFSVANLPHVVVGIVTRPGGPVSTRSAPQNATLGSVLGSEDLLVQTLTSEVASHGIGKGSTVTVDSRIYRVIHLWPDDGGMTLLECRT